MKTKSISTYNKLKALFFNDPLYRNSIFMMSSTFIMSAFGFLFWVYVAHIFPVSSVGIATALISLMTLISSFTHLGLNVGLIRYLPKSKNRNAVITSSVILVTLAAVIVSGGFLLDIQHISPRLVFLHNNAFYIFTFILFILATTYNFLLEGIFMAYRAAVNILIKNTVISILKLFFPLFLITYGSYGIFSSVALSTLVAVILAFCILIKKYSFKPTFAIKPQVVKEIAFFSGGNFLAGFLFQASTLILPIMIVNILHSKDAAYYYIDSMILNLLVIIPQATTDALLAEGSYNIKLIRNHFIKSVKIILLFLIPAITIIFFYGNYILYFFGKQYESEAFHFLQLISLSAVFISITYIGNVLLRLQHKITTLIFLSLLGSILILGFSYLFISYGLNGVGWGWLAGQALLATIYLAIIGNFFMKIEVKLPKLY